MSFFTPTHWQKVLSFLRSRTTYTAKEYKYWFSRLSPNYENNSSVIHICCPNQFIAFELQNKFCTIFEKIIYKITEKQYKVKFTNDVNKVNTDLHILEVKDAHLFTKKAATQELNQLKPANRPVNKPMKPSGLRQVVIPSVYSPDFEMPCSHIAQRYSFNNFVIGKSNQLAHTAALTVSDAPGTIYNPLFIYGDHGLGKSHLLHAIANQIRATDPHAKTMIMSAASFTSSYLNAVEANKLLEFTTHIKNADALLIDDIGHFTTHSYAVSELQKIISHYVTNQKLLVFTGNLNPVELREFSEEFSAGVLRGLSAVINQPEYQTRFEIIKLKAKQMEFNFNDEIVEFLAQNFAFAPRKLEGIVKKLGVHEQVRGILSIYDVRYLFQNEIESQIKRLESLSLSKIAQGVSKVMKVKLEDLISKKRNKLISQARQIAMYVSRRLTEYTYHEIGKYFGRDHSTAMYATSIVDVKTKEKTQNQLKSQIQQVLKELKITGDYTSNY